MQSSARMARSTIWLLPANLLKGVPAGAGRAMSLILYAPEDDRMTGTDPGPGPEGAA